MASTSTSGTRRMAMPSKATAGPSTAMIMNVGTRRNPELDMDGVNDNADDGGNGDPEVAANPWEICPKPDDEPPFICKLSGNNVSGFTELCGWSLQFPLKFSNIHASTKFKDITYDGRGNMVGDARDLKEKCIKLAEIKDMIGFQGQVNNPVYVQVVAKRRTNVFLKSNKLLVISLLVVADTSGYCVVCTFNEGAQTIHDAVSVGDFLLLTSCVVQECKRIYHRGLFSENMFLDLELKLQYHSVRNHYRRKFSGLKFKEFQLPATLFDKSCQLKLPSQLEKEFQNTDKPPWVTSEAEQYYDLIGVISYVSRIERHRISEVGEVECLVDKDLKLLPFKRYITYRWIYVIDRTSKPFPVKLYNLPLQWQDELVPGAHIVISHCQTSGRDFSAPFTITTHFSEIYLGAKTVTYYNLHPSFAANVKEILKRENYINIMSRDDCNWSIGGVPTTKILSEARFRHFYFENIKPEEMYCSNLARRESRRICFRGTILRAFKVSNEEWPSVYYIHERYKEIKQLKSSKYELLEHPLSYDMYKNISWYSFIRKLPAFNREVLKFPHCRDIVKQIVGSFEDYCNPLLMPAIIDEENLPPMADFEKVDGTPYFLLDIVDEERCHWYRCIWKSCDYTVEEMCKKVDSAKQMPIICLAEVFCIEENAPVEVILHDFVIDSDNLR